MINFDELKDIATAMSGEKLRRNLRNENFTWIDVPDDKSCGFFLVETSDGYACIATTNRGFSNNEELMDLPQLVTAPDLIYFRQFISIYQNKAAKLVHIMNGENKVENLIIGMGTYSEFLEAIAPISGLCQSFIYSVWGDNGHPYIFPYLNQYVGVIIYDLLDCSIMVPIKFLDEDQFDLDWNIQVIDSTSHHYLNELSIHYRKQANFINKMTHV